MTNTESRSADNHTANGTQSQYCYHSTSQIKWPR